MLPSSAGEFSWGRINQYSCQHIQPLHVQLCMFCSDILASGSQKESILIPVQCTTTLLWYPNRYSATSLNQVRINKLNYLILFKLYQRQSRPSSPVRLPHKTPHCPVILFVSVMHPFSQQSFQKAAASRPRLPPLCRLRHINTHCLSSEEAPDWSSVGAEYKDQFSSIHISHKSEDSFNFLWEWKTETLLWNRRR